MRTQAQILADVKAIGKQISELADQMGDCGGMQGAAVMYHHPEFRKQLEALEAEWKANGYLVPKEK